MGSAGIYPNEPGCGCHECWSSRPADTDNQVISRLRLAVVAIGLLYIILSFGVFIGASHLMSTILFIM